MMYDAGHEKIDLKVFVIVIPSFIWYEINCLDFDSFDFIDHVL